MVISTVGYTCSSQYNTNDILSLCTAQYQAIKDEYEQLKARTASDAHLQQKLQQDLINLEKVSKRWKYFGVWVKLYLKKICGQYRPFCN